MRFGSLFAGIGGFDLGLERAGMSCEWQVEIDPYAGRVLEKHWPSVRRWADVRTFPPSAPEDWAVDLICAGVPCQPISVAGKQKGSDDERWMWGEALRVVADIMPTFFVAENPRAILTHDRGRTFGGILRALARVGYVCEWHVVSAASVGAPHIRERVLLVADANGRRLEGERVEEHIDEQGARGGIADGCRAGGRRARADVADADGWGVRLPGCPESAGASGENKGKGSKRERLRDDVRPGRSGRSVRCVELADWWAVEPDVGRVANGVPSRVDRLRCLGNAIVPQVAEVIGRAIMALETNAA